MVRPADEFPAAIAAQRRLDRRRFLWAASAAAAMAAAGEWIGGAVAALRAQPIEITVDPHHPLAVGASRAVAGSDGGEALVVRIDAATVVAFDRRCPHLGCPVVWTARNQRFECPCHRAAFDARTGAVLFGPPRSGLQAAVVHTTTIPRQAPNAPRPSGTSAASVRLAPI